MSIWVLSRVRKFIIHAVRRYSQFSASRWHFIDKYRDNKIVFSVACTRLYELLCRYVCPSPVYFFRGFMDIWAINFALLPLLYVAEFSRSGNSFSPVAILNFSPLFTFSFSIAYLVRLVATRWYDFESGLEKFDPICFDRSAKTATAPASVHRCGFPGWTCEKHFAHDVKVVGVSGVGGGAATASSSDFGTKVNCL